MIRNTIVPSSVLVVLALITVLHSGCLSTGGRLVSTISPHINEIPTTVGIYPMLSSPIRHSAIMGRRVETSATMKTGPNDVYIIPPTDSELSVTSFSQMMTDLMSKDLLYYGFDLRELPVEIPDSRSADDKKNPIFSISIDLLKHLQEEYDVQAIMIGNAFFSRNPNSIPTVQVHAAHVKVIDITTLKVLCQVDLTFSDTGEDVDVISEEIAAQLASMAGLIREEEE